MSIAGGLYRALERGAELGCGAVQIFLKSHRQWACKPLDDEQVRAFHAARRRTRIRSVFAHSSYLVNLACPTEPLWRQAVDFFADEVVRAEALGLGWVVIHPGSHMGEGREAGIARVVRALDETIERTSGCRVKIALENTAGAGNCIGNRLDELGTLLDRVKRPERVGVCLDTCHLFAAGYDIRTPTGYATTMDECRRTIGFTRLLAFHLNDAKAPLGSGLDRHENIGAGFLGRRAFRLLLNDARFRRIPKVLETPKEPEPVADIKNLKILRSLRG